MMDGHAVPSLCGWQETERHVAQDHQTSSWGLRGLLLSVEARLAHRGLAGHACPINRLPLLTGVQLANTPCAMSLLGRACTVGCSTLWMPICSHHKAEEELASRRNVGIVRTIALCDCS